MLIRLTIEIPDGLYNHFAAHAAMSSPPQTPESFVGAHLQRTQFFGGSEPIFFGDSEAREIRRLFGKAAASTTSLLETFRKLLSLKMGGGRIRISESQQDYFFERAKAKGINLKDQSAIAKSVNEDIEEAIISFTRTR